MADLKKLKATAAGLPDKSGIYFFKNASGSVVYIGKARSLRDRVRSYFIPNPDDKVRNILRETAAIDFILTGSEKEAVFLENNFIQEHQPRFNLRLKDDKSYPYLRLSEKERYARISFSRRVEKDGARYFGPFSPAREARKSIHLVNKYFRIRGCEDAVFRTRKRVCLDHDLGLCSGPCVELITEDEYRDDVRNACLFLDGRTRELAKTLEAKMKRAAREQRFEDAARCRDLLATLEQIKEKPRTVSVSLEDQDAVGFARAGDRIAVYVFFMRKGKIRDSAEVILNKPKHLGDSEILSEVLGDCYSRHRPAGRLLLPFPLAGPDKLRALFGPPGKKQRIVVPRSGAGRRLVELAERNARALLEKKRSETAALEDLKSALGLEAVPRLIEGFDISDTGGDQTVGSLVVFRDGLPDKNGYRKYLVRTVEGPDDVASLTEVVFRRYSRLRKESGRVPDLIIVDGGKGQLAAAERALAKSGVEGVSLVSIAKKEEILYTPDKKKGLRLERRSAALKLIQRVRDEAHRFAVTYHRSRRSKRSFESQLDGIPGLGPKRKTSLLTCYRSIDAIRNAPSDELARLVGRGAAQALRERLAAK